MRVDFSTPNAYVSREEWEEEVRALPAPRLGQRELWEATRYMAYVDDAETVVNTHPFGYIGSENKGLNQAVETPGGSTRDAHGTYPSPGRYANVGPGGTTDQATRYLDSREFLRALEAGQEDLGPDFEPGSVLGLADPSRLRLLPDWERLVARDLPSRTSWRTSTRETWPPPVPATTRAGTAAGRLRASARTIPTRSRRSSRSSFRTGSGTTSAS